MSVAARARVMLLTPPQEIWRMGTCSQALWPFRTKLQEELSRSSQTQDESGQTTYVGKGGA
eukprot:2318202-Amphidinium_carterae.1